MDNRYQINHRSNARTISERLPQMSQHGVNPGENMISRNMYNHNYSTITKQKRVPQTSHKTNFYEDEYKKMVSCMAMKGVSVKNSKCADPFGELLRLAVLADEGYRTGTIGFIDSLSPSAPPPFKTKSRVSIHSLLKWKRHQDEKHELYMSMIQKLESKDIERFQHLQNVRRQRKISFGCGAFVEEFRGRKTSELRDGDVSMSNTSEGDSSIGSTPDADFIRSGVPDEDLRIGGTQDEDFGHGFVQSSMRPLQEKLMNIKSPEDPTKTAKVSTCRHFINGWCRQDDACSFEHIIEGSYPDTQKVFLGGLPHSITPAQLLWELRQQNYMVVNQPKIFGGFSPQVCLSSTAEAMKMLQQGKIMISGCTVDVRPYKALTKKERDRQLDTNSRSIFLGGLPSSVTVQVLKAEIKKLGMKVTNRLLIKAGFIPKVTLASIQQAQELVENGTIDICGAVVSVRPYISKSKPSLDR